MFTKLLPALALVAGSAFIASPAAAAPGAPGPADPPGKQSAPGQQTAPGLDTAPGQQKAPAAPPAAPPGQQKAPGQPAPPAQNAPGQQKAPGQPAPPAQNAPGQQKAPGQPADPQAAPAADPAPDRVEICHAAGDGYTLNTVSSRSITNGAGHSGHDGDIIPPFAGFGGLNWDATGQAIYAAGCDVDAVGPNPDPNANAKVTLCHANNGSKQYSLITVSINSVIKGAGHGAHGDDIIPPFTYEGGSYAGQNWTAGRAPLTTREDCVAGTDVGGDGGSGTDTEDVSDTAVLSSGGTAANASDASSDVDSSGWLSRTGGPAFWLLIVGLVAAIGGAIALRLRRSADTTPTV